jgi:hypothetical protein
MPPTDDLRDRTPPPLEYFAANEPARVRARGLNFWAVVLVVAWVPYLCGIVNASTVMASYSPPIIAQHRNGALLFMGAGLMLAAASLIGFVRQRHAWGVAAAGLVILVQLSLTACAGLASR